MRVIPFLITGRTQINRSDTLFQFTLQRYCYSALPDRNTLMHFAYLLSYEKTEQYKQEPLLNHPFFTVYRVQPPPDWDAVIESLWILLQSNLAVATIISPRRIDWPQQKKGILSRGVSSLSRFSKREFFQTFSASSVQDEAGRRILVDSSYIRLIPAEFDAWERP
jgi:hypothetical protein